jgi:hypothetical protein
MLAVGSAKPAHELALVSKSLEESPRHGMKISEIDE